MLFNYGKLQVSQHELFHSNRCIALVGIQHTISQRKVMIMIFSYIIKVLERMTVTGFEVE